MKKIPPFSYFDVLEACTQPGCPFCRLAEKSVNGYLDALLYEQVNDPGTREALSYSQGFCNEHAHRLPDVNMGASLGIAIIYRDLVNQVAGEIEKAHYALPSKLQQVQESLDRDKPAVATEATVRSLRPRARCPACAHRDAMETIALAAMLDALPNDERMRTALKSTSGVCLPHLRRAFELTRTEAAFAVLRDIAQAKVKTLLGELDEFIRKNDHRFNKEEFGPEGDSWRRAFAWIVGQKGIQ